MRLAVRRRLTSVALATGLLVEAALGPAIASLLVAVLEGLAPTASALGLRSLLNGFIAHKESQVLLATVVVIAGFVSVSFLMPIATYLQTEVDRRVELLVSDRLFTALNAVQRLDQLEQPEFLDQVRLAQQAGLQAPQQIAGSLISGVSAGVMLAGFAVALVQADVRIAVLAFVAVIPSVVIGVRLSARRAAAEMELSPGRRRAFFYSVMQTDMRAAKEIRLFGLGDYLRLQMIEVLRSVTGTERQRDRTVLRWQVLLQTSGFVFFAGAIALASREVWRGSLEVGDMAFVLAALAAVQSGVSTLNVTIGQLVNTLTLFDNYGEVVTASKPHPARAQQASLGRLERGISLRDVWFRYDERAPWVLRGVDLTLPAGTVTALVGLNGAGKSTLVKLLCGLYAPTRGEIYWDDIPIDSVDLDEYRRHFSAVFQDFMTYDLTAWQNIAIGDLERQDEDEAVFSASRAAGLHEFLTALPAGYDTLLSRVFVGDDGQRGISLSGGQWQRLAIARALMRADPDVLILDEPSSGLDAEAEQHIIVTLRALRHKQTSVMISHRLNAVVDVDNIVVLADGVIAEQGTHDALLRRKGRYAELFELQAGGYRDGSDVVG
jgi:ATP-binding cassette subfamily B protein